MPRYNLSEILPELELNALRDLLMEWLDTQADIESLLNRDFGDLPPVSDGDLDAQLAAIGQEQTDLIRRLAVEPASTKEGILAKLYVWADLVGPRSQNDDWVQPSDKLVYSVLQDLSA